MRIKLKFFASIRELVGSSGEEIDIPEGTTVSSFLDEVRVNHGPLRHMERILVAVNGEYVEPDVLLKKGDVVALFPPVSGG